MTEGEGKKDCKSHCWHDTKEQRFRPRSGHGKFLPKSENCFVVVTVGVCCNCGAKVNG